MLPPAFPASDDAMALEGERLEVVVGVRFSLWKADFARLAPERFYSEERLSEKAFLFGNVTCPSMERQSDQQFKLVAFVDDHLPVRYRRVLEGLPRVTPLPVRTYQEIATNRSLAPILDPRTRRVALVRLDDDDALHPDFIRTLKRVLRRRASSDLFAVDFPSGLQIHARRVGDGAVVDHVQPLFYSHAAQGLTSVSGIEERNAYCCRHSHIDDQFPVVSVPSLHPAYLRVLMEHNNSSLRHGKPAAAANVSFALDPHALELLFSPAPT